MDAPVSDRPDRGGHAWLAVAAAGVVLLVVLGVLPHDRVPALDSWGLQWRVAPDSPVETLVKAVSDGLRLAGGTAAVVIAAAAWDRCSRPRPMLMAGPVAAAAVTAMTRVLLGEHHLTDVVATAAGYGGAALFGVRVLRARATSLVGDHHQ